MVSLAPTPRGRQDRRAYQPVRGVDVTVELEALVTLPTSVFAEDEIVPALTAVCATRCRTSRVGVVLADGGVLRLLPRSFGVISDEALPVDSSSDPAAAHFLTGGRAETWNALSSLTPFPLPDRLRLRRLLGVPLTRDGDTLGVLLLADNAVSYTSADLDWADRIAPALAATIDTTLRLLAGRAEASRAREAERIRLAEDLHDSALQLLFAADATIGAVVDAATTPVDSRLVRARELVDGTSCALRDLVVGRTTRREALSERLLDLIPSLAQMYDTQLTVEITAAAEQLGQRLAPARVDALERVAREAAVNALKHGHASQISIALSCAPGDMLMLTIADNGDGIADVRPSGGGGFGLRSLRRSMQRCGGELEIESVASGGTRVTALVTV